MSTEHLPLSNSEEDRIYPIAKQIMLGRWAGLESATYLLFFLCLAALLISFAQPKPISM